ncbi:MAG: NADH:ubiquinone reductase (Na(+)-transporting) subunit F [Pigmentiphaga sp.]|uniref:NADH:ubiquinone reductase (Na(+)-transporting) subunit F n=1 Tax=Pigmentiphaga sp. TaxID=1977564 RepID=UPI003B581646
MSYQLTIEPLGQTIDIEPGQTVLDACLRSGIWLPHACGHGLCGTCKVHVQEGEVDHGAASSFALMDFERDEGHCLACCAMPEADLMIEADIDEEPDAQYLPLEDYVGEVVALRDLTPTIKGVWLRTDRPVRFQAGQYANLAVPGVEGRRAFSLANAPGDNVVELHVRKVEGGAATGYIHEHLREGECLPLSAPFGRFYVRKSAQVPMIFLAGGSGLSSPKSMIAELLAEGCEQPITLVHGARHAGELYCSDWFQELAVRHPNFRYVPALSEAHDGEGRCETGFVHEVLARLYAGQDGRADFRGHKAYLCGPPPMIEACIATLMQGRLFERDIHVEKFLTAAQAQEGRRSPLFKAI